MEIHLRKLKKNKGLYLAGAVTAVGLAAFLYSKLKDRIDFSIGPAHPAVTEMKEKLEEKEAQLAEGKIESLKKRIQRAEKTGLGLKPIREAVVDYVTEDIEDKLSHIGISKRRLNKIVKEVHNRTEEILALTDVEKLVNNSDTPQDQVASVIRAIRPQLLEEIKKIRKD
jgi:predicted transcriptional regulator